LGDLLKLKGEAYWNSNTTSNIVQSDDGNELNLYDLAGAIEATEMAYDTKKNLFWNIIENTDLKSPRVIDKLLKAYSNGKTANLSADERKEFESLQQRLLKAGFDGKGEREPANNLNFGKVFRNDDKVESADVVMADGEIATYYGETSVGKKSGKRYVYFFGSKQDYRVSLEVAKALKVVNVEYYS
jgi:hypothetical protein